jgi:hypothetical protein
MQTALATSNGTDEVASVAAGLIQSLWGSLPSSVDQQGSGLATLLLYTGNSDPKAHPAVTLESSRLVCFFLSLPTTHRPSGQRVESVVVPMYKHQFCL